MAGLTSFAWIGLQTLFEHRSLAGGLCLILLLVYKLICRPLFISGLRKIPGPTIYALTTWRLAWSDFRGTRTRDIHALHQRCGSAVRVAPNEVSFSSLAALRTIYGAGSGFQRTDFYRMFDVYGRQNLFTFASSKDHGDRKKVLANAYSKSTILSPHGIAKPLVERNVQLFLNLIETERNDAQEIFRSLHWYSLDSITGFLYGQHHGGTQALRGNEDHRSLLLDIIDNRRRLLSWYAVHLRRYTAWLYSRTGLMEAIVVKLGLLPMSKPATYTGIRSHALRAWKSFEVSAEGEATAEEGQAIVHKLRKHQLAGKGPQLDGLDCASEAADHFLAGIDTTSDTLMFLIWQLSRTENLHYQSKLMEEVDAIPQDALNLDGNPTVETADRLPYLDALIKEALRLHAPLPASEPRSLPVDSIIDGHRIPAGTVVSMAQYTLHRSEVFIEPQSFRPERWLGDLGSVDEMKKFWWAFSSGGRMCIGMHLATAEMTTLMASLYRRYRTRLQPKQEGVSPGITSRFEIFYDETFDRVSEHACYVEFVKRDVIV